MDLMTQWLEASGVTDPTLEDILKAADEMEDFFNGDSDEG